ncbi:hypothetical protein HYV57_00450 [Candidatus Peregrinibacteria bacterium]|nr:hypothetical protein [Candidatus Peregrinibacteria bacterium]
MTEYQDQAIRNEEETTTFLQGPPTKTLTAAPPIKNGLWWLTEEMTYEKYAKGERAQRLQGRHNEKNSDDVINMIKSALEKGPDESDIIRVILTLGNGENISLLASSINIVERKNTHGTVTMFVVIQEYPGQRSRRFFLNAVSSVKRLTNQEFENYTRIHKAKLKADLKKSNGGENTSNGKDGKSETANQRLERLLDHLGNGTPDESLHKALSELREEIQKGLQQNGSTEN